MNYDKTYRFKIINLAIIILFVVIIFRIFYITLFVDSYDSFKLSYNPQEKNLVLPRRSIVDRNNFPLAVSINIFDIIINPKTIGYESIKLLEEYFADNEKLFKEIHLNQDRKIFIYKRSLSLKQVEKIKATFKNKKVKFTGINFNKRSSRYYPLGEITSRFIGATTKYVTDKIEVERGQFGLELKYDGKLKFIKLPYKIKSFSSKVLTYIGFNSGRTESDLKPLKLTLDYKMQTIAYQKIKQAVEENEALSGSIILIDYNNGQLLADAIYPSFNPNNRQNLNFDQIYNSSFTSLYEPGSTMKPLIMLKALIEGIDRNRIFSTAPINLGHSLLFEANHIKKKKISLDEIISLSSNVGISTIALELKRKKVISIFKDFGFDFKTNINFPGEKEGVIPQLKNNTDLTRSSFGYLTQITPIQLVAAYQVIANNGIKIPLRLVPVKTQKEKISFKLFDEKPVLELKKMLRNNIKQGTGKKANLLNYRVYGKTGTAQKFKASEGYSNDFITSFIGFLDNPKLLLLVILNSPKLNKSGGLTAAPVFKEILEEVVLMQ